MFPEAQVVPGFSIKMFKKLAHWHKWYSALHHRAEESLQPQEERTAVFCLYLIGVKIDTVHNTGFLRQGQWQERKLCLQAPTIPLRQCKQISSIFYLNVLAWVMFDILICIFFSKKINQCSLKWHLISSKGNCLLTTINHSKRPTSVDLSSCLNKFFLRINSWYLQSTFQSN